MKVPAKLCFKLWNNVFTCQPFAHNVTFGGCSVKSAWQTRFQMLQKCLLANVDDNLPWVPGTSKTCSKWKTRRLSSIILAMPLKNLVKLKRVIFVKPRVCIGCSVAQDRVGVGSMGPSVQLHHAAALFTPAPAQHSIGVTCVDISNWGEFEIWRENLYFPGTQCKENHKTITGTPYTAGLSQFILFCCNVCCFDALYAVLMHSMLFWCTLCSFIEICVAL